MDHWDNVVDSLPSTSMSLVKRLQAREPDAWQEAVHLYGPLVFGWCRSKHLKGEDARDVTQEVFRNLAEKIDQFRTDQPGATFRGWLSTITAWRLADFHRRQGREPAAEGGTENFDQLLQTSESPDSSSLWPNQAAARWLDLLETVRAEFSDRIWRAFWRTTADGLTAAEVATELGCSVGAVYMAKSRVLTRIRSLASSGANGT